MKLILENTSKVVVFKTSVLGDGLPCRVWEGETDTGIKVHAFIPRVGVKDDQDCSQFERELKEQRAPSAEVVAFPLRMIL